MSEHLREFRNLDSSCSKFLFSSAHSATNLHIILLEMTNLRKEDQNVPCHCKRPPAYGSHYQRWQNLRTSYEGLDQDFEDFEDLFMGVADAANRWAKDFEFLSEKLVVPAPDDITPESLSTLSEFATCLREGVEVFENQAMVLEETANVLDAALAHQTELYASSGPSSKGSKRTRASTKRHRKLWRRLFHRY